MHSPHKYTAVDYMGHRPGLCDICNEPEGHPVHVYTLAGMEGSDQQREEARQLQQAEELTARLIEARPSIDAKAGEMEANSPLFYGTIHPTLF